MQLLQDKDLTVKWHKCSAILYLYGNITRIQPVANQLTRVPSCTQTRNRGVVFIVAEWLKLVATWQLLATLCQSLQSLWVGSPLFRQRLPPIRKPMQSPCKWKWLQQQTGIGDWMWTNSVQSQNNYIFQSFKELIVLFCVIEPLTATSCSRTSRRTEVKLLDMWVINWQKKMS